MKFVFSFLLLAVGILAQDQDPASSISFLSDFQNGEWATAPKTPFAIQSFTGNVARGLIVFGGIAEKQGAFLTDIAGGQWATIKEAPFEVKRCTGNNARGPIIFGGKDNRQVAFMSDYSKNEWRVIAPAPFPVKDISGNNQKGPIILSEDGRKVAYMSDYSTNLWKIVASTPFQANAVAGENSRGILIAGGSNNQQVAYLKAYTENRWYQVANAPFPIRDIAGNNQFGPVILGGENGRKVAYMNDYQENRWRVVGEAPQPGSEICGGYSEGVAIGGQTAYPGQPKTIVKKVYKTAVVEFSERGNLGIKDAGVIIAEWITTALNKTGAFEVYERISLNTLMEEHKLGMSGLLDEATIAEVGRVRGVQAIVTGSVIKFGNIISVTAKVIDVNTAKIIKSADVKVKSISALTDEIDRLAWELAK